AEKREHLDEGDTQEHGGAELAGDLGLAGHALDGLADQDAETDTRAGGGEAVADSVQVTGDLGESGDVHLRLPSVGRRTGVVRRRVVCEGAGAPVAGFQVRL